VAGKQTIVAAVVPPADAKPVRKRKHVSASHQATIAAPVVPPQPKRPRAKVSSGSATLVATKRPAKTHAATIAAAVVPPARDLPSSRVTDVPASAPKRTEIASKPSQLNTMAAPVVPIESARPGRRRALALQATMVATDAPDELADEIHIELSDSVIAKVPPEIRRETKVRVKAPTFDNLTVIAPRNWGWIYATSAAAVLLVVLLLAIP
jgi:hypothetical protein